MSPRLLLKRGLERGRCPKVKLIPRSHLRGKHRLRDLHKVHALRYLPEGGIVMRFKAMGVSIDPY